MNTLTWKNSQEQVDWTALQELFRIAPLGDNTKGV